MPSEMKVNKISPADSTTVTLGDSGDTINIPSGVTLSGSGANLTALNASNLGSGTVPTARLGTGTANSSVHLRGDGTWAAAGGGKVLQYKQHFATNPQTYNNSMTTSTELWSTTFTPTASDSKVLIHVCWRATHEDSSDGYWFGGLYRGSTQIYIFGESMTNAAAVGEGSFPAYMYLDSPATTSAITYKMMPYYGVSYSSSHFYISRMGATFLELGA